MNDALPDAPSGLEHLDPVYAIHEVSIGRVVVAMTTEHAIDETVGGVKHIVPGLTVEGVSATTAREVIPSLAPQHRRRPIIPNESAVSAA